jgi:hypothetical protein
MKRNLLNTLLVASAFATGSFQSPAQTTTAVRPTELRADKLGSAAVVGNLAAGVPLRLVSLEGGWALVEGAGVRGWARASTLDLKAGSSAASALNSGRQAGGNTALTLGTRGLTPRVNRHALIIGIGRYGDPSIPPLPGVQIDRESATQMATAMQVPASNITYLQNEQATSDNIRAALRDLNNRIEEGDRVFIHYSGHGTRFNDPAAGGCVEALLAYEGTTNAMLTNREMASLLKPITNKTDKLFVIYDACHSGGLVSNASTARTRSLAESFSNRNDDGQLLAKVGAVSADCSRPVNVKTRNLLVETVTTGALPQDIVHVSAARDDEISFDDSLKGGLATQFMRDCMLRDAKDLDGSGAIDINEIRMCAQDKLNKRLLNDANYKPHNIMVTGNTSFVPAWFSQVALAPVAQPVSAPPQAIQAPSQSPPVAAAPAVKPPPAPVATVPAAKPPQPAPVAPPTVVAVVTPPPPPVVQAPPAPVPQLTGEQALRQMFNQRDAKRQVRVVLAKTQLKIGQDALDFAVQSDRGGYVYVALAGSDNKSLYLLFPNDLDQSNRIEAGQQLALPRPNWRAKAGGPAGTDNLLVLVTDGPRDLGSLAASKAGPFVTSLNDSEGRAKLGALMTTSSKSGAQECSSANRKGNAQCSDAYGAAMLSVEEVK